ncbi:MAG: aminoacyl-tRNA hydrolase [Clostridia bacterium]|nr:aminoacyl-tRNA hydrolase [Clostridia bacterium]
MYLIVGLGNPGIKYKSTYHNIGFMTVDKLAKEFKIKFVKQKGTDSHVAEGEYKGERFVLAKPDTFMNLSGNAVKALVKKYRVDVEGELVVIYDDADLPLGKTRMREEGSAGSHNGMRSIVGMLGRTDFKRIRIGMKTAELAEKDVKLIDLVLSKVDYEDKPILEEGINASVEAVKDLIAGKDIQRIEEVLNRRK